MTEKGLENKIRQYVAQKGGICWKWVSPGQTGVPDRIAILPGPKIVFIEVKRPGLKDGRSERQKKVFSILEKLGCSVWLVSDFAVFKEKIDAL